MADGEENDEDENGATRTDHGSHDGGSHDGGSHDIVEQGKGQDGSRLPLMDTFTSPPSASGHAHVN